MKIPSSLYPYWLKDYIIWRLSESNLSQQDAQQSAELTANFVHRKVRNGEIFDSFLTSSVIERLYSFIHAQKNTKKYSVQLAQHWINLLTGEGK